MRSATPETRRLGRTRPTAPLFRVARCAIVAFASLSLLAAACGEDEPELTIEERLADVEGRELTETEVGDKLATAGILCQMDEQVLDALWQQLNERQLNFQDVVFSQICPDRAIFYAGLTGRYVTDEAVESGVVTSTTRPTTTTTAPATVVPTTAPRATIAPAPTTAAGVDSDSTGGAETDTPPTLGSATTRVGEGG